MITIRTHARPGAVSLAVAIMLATTAVHGQVVRLETPEAVLRDAFSFVRGVRELASGRLLVADWIENRVSLVDLAAGTARPVLREGAGPGETRLPMGLIPLPGDSTLLLDYGNNRLTVLGPTGTAVRSLNASEPGRGAVRGVLSTGDYVFAMPAWAEGPAALPNDSVRVMRWNPGRREAPQPIAVVHGTPGRRDRSPSREPRIPIVGFATQDAWTVLSSGALAIVRGAPWHVEVHQSGGIVRGAPVTAATRPVTRDDKRRFVREFSAGAPQSGRGPNGGMGRAPLPDAAAVERFVETTEWATSFPPFDAGAVHATADGALWVGRPEIPGEPRRYEVFNARGAHLRQVVLPLGRRVVAVGRRGVYVVTDDDSGMQAIERYRLP